MRARRALPARQRRPRARQRRGRAARPVGGLEPRQGRTDRAGPLARPRRLPPRLSGRSALARLRLRAVGAPDRGRQRSRRCTRASSARRRIPGQLALQYWFFYLFNDYNDKHEGDWEMIQLDFAASDAAQALTKTPDGDRLQPARGRRAGALGRLEARARRRHAPGRVPGGRLARELLRAGALPRPQRSAGCRLRRDDRAVAPAASDGRRDPDRQGRVSRGVPLARLRRALGRAAARLLQRPDRAEHEAPVDGADHLGGDLVARHELHRPRGNARSARPPPTSSAAPSPPARIC